MTLVEASEQYIGKRQAGGYAFQSGARTLRAFSKSIGPIALSDVDANHVLSYLNRSETSNITWRLKHWTLRRFFEHWCHRKVLERFTMPLAKPKVTQTFVPYIYAPWEIRLLLETSNRDRRVSLGIYPLCSSAMLVFLYATGACIGETCLIRFSDLDLSDQSVTIRSARSKRQRTVPLGGALAEYLKPYVAWRAGILCSTDALFINKGGAPVSPETFGKRFSLLRRDAPVCRRDGAGHKPRVEDLRHTFAVHRIDRWIREEADLNRMLPALAAYMGQNGLGATNRYLFMTPERFRKDLDKLSPIKGQGGWGEDHTLMSLLAQL